jgi:hypothetical protein
MEQRVGSLRFQRGEAKAMIVVNPQTGLVAGFGVRRPSPPATGHATYVDTTAFRAVEVKVGSEPFLLGATLTLPTRSSMDRAPRTGTRRSARTASFATSPRASLRRESWCSATTSGARSIRPR